MINHVYKVIARLILITIVMDTSYSDYDMSGIKLTATEEHNYCTKKEKKKIKYVKYLFYFIKSATTHHS